MQCCVGGRSRPGAGGYCRERSCQDLSPARDGCVEFAVATLWLQIALILGQNTAAGVYKAWHWGVHLVESQGKMPRIAAVLG